VAVSITMSSAATPADSDGAGYCSELPKVGLIDRVHLSSGSFDGAKNDIAGSAEPYPGQHQRSRTGRKRRFGRSIRQASRPRLHRLRTLRMLRSSGMRYVATIERVHCDCIPHCRGHRLLH
jgi:hypothetical protein